MEELGHKQQKLIYLKGTLFLGLHLPPTSHVQPMSFKVFCQADWSSNVDEKPYVLDASIFSEKIKAAELFIYHIPALNKWAGVLTNPLSSACFAFLRDKLNV
ncbi:hypothetical protein V8G54_024012 [Vigna mungo]|uniref:Uncharacterized protein n=1 Tax=Vigna mungo TaxID=3915 RepID=A0AAQ3N609_VIGMU